MNQKLSGVPETLLITLWARAFETLRSNPIIRDNKAVKMVSQIDYDFSKFETVHMSQIGVAVRTLIFDKAVSAFLHDNPDAIVINLGAGLDTRYARLSNTRNCWYDLDVQEVIDIKRHFCDETRTYHMISKSVFDTSWMSDIKIKNKPILLIAEGLFMYFEESELKLLFKELTRQFPSAELLFDIIPPFLVGRGNMHDSVRKIDGAEFKWGMLDARAIETWNFGIKFVNEWNLINYHRKRWGWFWYFSHLPFIGPRLATKVVHLSF